MLEVEVSGQAEMRRVAARMRHADRNLDRDLVNGIRRAIRPLGPAIKAAVPVYLPSGYAPVMAASLRANPSIRRTRGPGVSVKVYAVGKVENRAVRAINAGALRHPVFGRRRDPWVTQKVRSGFVTDPFQRMRGPVLAEMERVVHATVERIARG